MAAEAIALLGGSYDPVHRGHIALAEELLQKLPVQELRLLPAACSPLKSTATAFEHRRRMLELACAGHPGLVVDDREGRRPPPSYSIDTLQELRREHAGPLILVLGEDTLPDLERWKNMRGLLDYAHLLIIKRPDPLRRPLPAGTQAWLEAHRAELPSLSLCTHGHVAWLDTPYLAIASSAIRQALARGDKQAMEYLAPAVAAYIMQHRLYLSENDTTHEH